ncbi:MAG: glycosyltransferase family 1 protein [Anaerolineales bacterium]|nr:glycosyltransferase family 1 protein [Anaerolineales bacterium]
MRIGVMLRSIDEKGGVGVYTRNIIKELLELDRHNEYILMYRNPASMGRFSDRDNVNERLVRASNKAVWDQLAVPAACRSENTDVVFHPKFTVPLLSPCPAVMVVHGADWLIPEQAQYYPAWDVRYMKAILPLYIKKSAAVISVSQETTDNFNRLLDLPDGKVRTIYFAPARHFARVTDRTALDTVRIRYQLPHRFIFTLTKPKGDTRKNFGRIVKAYALYHQSTDAPRKLVVGGRDLDQLKEIYDIPSDGYGLDIHFPGWIDQADMPAVYSQADLFLYPSNLEAFPIPLTEAMSCGTPILTSNVNGLLEIAGNAADLVDPADPSAICRGMTRILDDPERSARLSEEGLARAHRYSWDTCARKTLGLLEQVAAG